MVVSFLRRVIAVKRLTPVSAGDGRTWADFEAAGVSSEPSVIRLLAECGFPLSEGLGHRRSCLPAVQHGRETVVPLRAEPSARAAGPCRGSAPLGLMAGRPNRRRVVPAGQSPQGSSALRFRLGYHAPTAQSGTLDDSGQRVETEMSIT